MPGALPSSQAKPRQILAWRRFGDGSMRWLRILASVVVLGGVAGALGIVWMISYFGKDLPDHRELSNYQPSNATRVHAGDGRLIGEFATERRVFVPITAIPKRLIHAVVATEDQNFYTH